MTAARGAIDDPVATQSAPPAQDTAYLDRLETALGSAEQALADATMADSQRTTLAVSVVIPIYNQRETIVESVRRVQAVGRHREIVIVDDFSLDGTRQVLLELAAEDDIRVVMHGYHRGKGAALRTALAEAQGEVILIQDANLEYDPIDYPRLLAPLERGETDVVYGSRFLENPSQDSCRVRRFGNWLLTLLSNQMNGHHLTDMATCCKVFRRQLLDGMQIKQQRFGFEPEFTAKLSQQGHRIVEVPIAYHRRYETASGIDFRDGLNALWCVLWYGV